MKTLLKISLIATSVLLVSTNGHSQEEARHNSHCGAPLYDKNVEDNLLFQFILQSKILQVLEDNEAVVKKFGIKDLPYRALSNQLEAILCRLIADEVSVDTRVAELRNQLKNMPIGKTRELLHQNLEKIFHLRCNEMSCQNALDERSLNLIIEYFTCQFYEELETLNPKEQAQLLSNIYEQQLKDYYELCEKHKTNLDKIQERANLQFLNSADDGKKRLGKPKIKSLSGLMEDTQEPEIPVVQQPEPSSPEPISQAPNLADTNPSKEDTEIETKVDKQDAIVENNIDLKEKPTDVKKEKGSFFNEIGNKTKEIVNKFKNWFKRNKQQDKKK